MLAYDISFDWFLRISSMALLFVFFAYTLVLSKRAGEAGIGAKKNYFFAFSFFFLMYAINFLQTELMLAGVYEYPHVIPTTEIDGFGYRLDLGFLTIQPITGDIFLFLFFFLGAAPLSFAIEKYLLLHKKTPLTILVSAAAIMNVLLILVFPLNVPFIHVVVAMDYLAMIASVLTILIIYLRIAIVSSGKLRGVGFLMFFGLVLQIAALFLSSMSLGDFFLSGAEVAHLIGLIGFLLIFASIIQMR